MLLGVGLGKSSISLGVIKTLLSKGLMESALIITPLRPLYHTWPAEIAKWEDFNGLTYSILHGKDKDKALAAKADIYLINPEGLAWLLEQGKLPFDVLIVDESTKFKHANTQRFKLLRKLIAKFRRRYILTGTPTTNGLMDLFGQIYILDEGASLGRYITHYRNEYFIPDRYGFNWAPQKDAMERITQKIAPLVMRMEAKDYLELPELMNDYRVITLPPEAREIYKNFETEFISVVNKEVIIAPNAAAAGNKCLQVLGGAVYLEDGDDYEEIHDAKIEALKDLIEELSGEPLLVFYQFNHERERLMEILKVPAIGQQSGKKDGLLIEAFNAGILPVLMAHPASAGHGLNLQSACAHVCFFSQTYNLEHYEQAIGRVLRQGNTHNWVIVHHLVIENSLDEVLLEVLAEKDRTQSTFLNMVKRLRA